jgi:hypothetical protein
VLRRAMLQLEEDDDPEGDNIVILRVYEISLGLLCSV